MTSVKFKLVIEVDNAEVFNEELGSECVSGVAGRLQDIADNKDLFELLAKCASSEVRSDIAYKDNLNEDNIKSIKEFEVLSSVEKETVKEKAAKSDSREENSLDNSKVYIKIPFKNKDNVKNNFLEIYKKVNRLGEGGFF